MPSTEVELTRTNTFEPAPTKHWQRLCLLELLDTTSTLVNVVTYHRRQAHIKTDSRSNVWSAISKQEIRDRFQPDLGRAITDKMLDKCDEQWNSFFESLDKYQDPDNTTVTDEPSPPWYWKENGKRVLRACIRNDAYDVEWGDDESYLKLALGGQLKEKYGIALNQRLKVQVKGEQNWSGKQGRLELSYDRTTESFTARQPVTTLHDTTNVTQRATGSRDEEHVAAVDVGANNLVAVTTTTGHQRLYHGRPLFDRFHALTEDIAALQSRLPENQYSSKRIESLYDTRSGQRDHAQDALVRDLVEWLASLGVSEVFVGKLDDVLKRHWSALVNEKTHLFWAHGRFRRRLREVCEEYGLSVREESEAGTSSCCSRCGSEHVSRNGDVFACVECGFEGHSDLVGSENFLQDVMDGQMALPVARDQNRSRGGHREVPRLQWNDHEWELVESEPRGQSTNEESQNQPRRETPLPVGVGSPDSPMSEIPRL